MIRSKYTFFVQLGCICLYLSQLAVLSQEAAKATLTIEPSKELGGDNLASLTLSV